MPTFAMNDIRKQLTSRPPQNGKFYTIAIDGRGGSGKSTLAHTLQITLPEFIHLNGDDYFEPQEDRLVWGAFNDKRFIQEVIEPLKKHNSFIYRPYDWHTDPPIKEQKITIEHGLCLERCYSFRFDLRWDLKIWVETPKEICLKRGVARERLPRETVLRTWKEVWQPLEDTYIATAHPEKQADIIIDGTRPFDDQIK